MKTLVSTVVILSLALLVSACGGDDQSQGATDVGTYAATVEPAVSDNTDPDFTPAMVNEKTAETEASDAEAQLSPEPKRPEDILALSKDHESLFILSQSGMIARTGDEVLTVTDEPTVATISHNGQRWLATEGALTTTDGSVEIVPTFATSITSLAEFNGDLYVGTSGDGVWKVEGGSLEPVSEPYEVIDLAGADFGLFAVTTKGLFSYRSDRWQRRTLGDSSQALAAPTALYVRYPFVYVGSETALLRYDGGRWESFEIAAPVSTMGWHNARLYIGGTDGSLSTLDGTVTESVPSPEAGSIVSILRFDGRLHVATAQGVFRLRHGRFEKLDWSEPAESETETEPIASLL